MAHINKWVIMVYANGAEVSVIEGQGKANREKVLRSTCTDVALSSGGEVWVTSSQAKAWQVWDCKKGERFATRGRLVFKEGQ